MRPLPGQLALFEQPAGDASTGAAPQATPPVPIQPEPRRPSRAAAPPSVVGDGVPTASAPDGADPIALFAAHLAELLAAPGPPAPSELELRQARDDWLRRLQAGRRSESALAAYRIAIDDLLVWSGDHAPKVF